MSPSELERLSRAYIRQVGRILGEDMDIPAPDVYTTPQIISLMMDEYAFMRGYNVPGMITGKPLPLGGSAGRGDATARGGMCCVREAAKKLGMNTDGATMAIQGFGNAGQYAATLGATLLGLKTVAVSDSQGGIYNPHGLDGEAVIAHKNDTGSVINFPGADNLTNAELLELNRVDILTPALWRTRSLAIMRPGSKRRSSPSWPTGRRRWRPTKILYGNGRFVLPDFLCNAGGVASRISSGANAYGYYWKEAQVHELLDEKMTAAFHSVAQAAGKYGVNNRIAAYVVAVGRVAEACKLRGWV